MTWGQADPLEEGTSTHSSILAWRIPWTEKPGGLQCIWLHRVGHDPSELADTHTSPIFTVNSAYTAAAAAKSLQSCPTLCDPIDGSRPGSAIPGILQARILEWVVISFSNA